MAWSHFFEVDLLGRTLSRSRKESTYWRQRLEEEGTAHLASCGPLPLGFMHIRLNQSTLESNSDITNILLELNANKFLLCLTVLSVPLCHNFAFSAWQLPRP